MVVQREAISDQVASRDALDRILVTEKLSEEGIKILRKSFEVHLKYDLSPEELLQTIGDYEALIVRSGTKVNRELLSTGKRLKVVGRAGVGVDNIDLKTATERGILVVNAPTGNCVAAAEHTIAHICALSRYIAQADASMKQGKWERTTLVGSSLEGKTLGVVGLGRIGREVARRARGLGMKIIAHDPYTSEETARSLGIKLEALSVVVSKGDFVTLHVPLIDSTKNLLNRELISRMKPGARVLNIARGGLIDEEALLEALEEGRIAGAGLDCFVTEPPSKVPDSTSNRLAKHPKVLATPHLGASTVEAQLDVSLEIAEAVSAALLGELVPTMVNAPVVSSEALSHLKPRALLAERLGRLAYSFANGNVSGEVTIRFSSSGNEGENRLIRAGLIKGLMEPGCDHVINVVNADNISKAHGLQVTEVNRFSNKDEDAIILEMKGSPSIEGRVVGGKPHVTRIGDFELDLLLEGLVLAYYQTDMPGQIGKVGSILGQANVNISFMTLGRHLPSKKAMVLLGLDNEPDTATLERIRVQLELERKPVLLDLDGHHD
ncbi:D-3-phosphoglycerate dehydrogenase [Galdieria sulphuraria]|uniref:D-3-phosphoglycerate dehydrogenase n=1 Tax=Galdieria sulphuraria TaxID=130081 RepID=M2Y5T5_GALSU|nr:D-3-phosphoglycerate dehydrogenase [Galdieria sulphuraria]EME31323.1 D-3-phosphoglycerate dehydrogenase [Galdieria sulphuraria]|eukprot:XP_005707843.1 D-3-phosphoglycerate dehydrogenase [Galdieria sulphuraria]